VIYFLSGVEVEVELFEDSLFVSDLLSDLFSDLVSDLFSPLEDDFPLPELRA
jgi:hypothetical protein